MRAATEVRKQLQERIKTVYDNLVSENKISETVGKLNELTEEFQSKRLVPSSIRWSEKDVVLITYADQISDRENPTLATLNQFLDDYLPGTINIVHLLPFYPYSSDDGFSVIDYYNLAPGIGSWNDVQRLNQSVDLMFDLVLNHCSKHHTWFKKFLLADPLYQNYFHEIPPETDLSKVTRPRSLPLLSEFETVNGKQWVWTTFSEDQVDLDFGNPDVLIEMIRILLFYVDQGARIIRLDAVAFLWKTIGTSCIHLPQTHEVIKILRDILALCAPEVILLTETNVPHEENLSYFGEGDEAHMVYQFSLPPLLIDTFVHEDPTPLRNWLLDLKPGPADTTYFNFAASHDGIGVRPLEGLLEQARFESLIQKMEERGGIVSTREKPDGSNVPYELNIAYFDAIAGNPDDPDTLKIRKFIASQSMVLALPGIPGIYFHSLVGTLNDSAAAANSGIPRKINRRKYDLQELKGILDNTSSIQHRLLRCYRQMIDARTQCPAFHPEAACHILDENQSEELGSKCLLALERFFPESDQKVLAIVNPTSSTVKLNLNQETQYYNLVSQRQLAANDFKILPFDFLWIQLR